MIYGIGYVGYMERVRVTAHVDIDHATIWYERLPIDYTAYCIEPTEASWAAIPRRTLLDLYNVLAPTGTPPAPKVDPMQMVNRLAAAAKANVKNK